MKKTVIAVIILLIAAMLCSCGGKQPSSSVKATSGSTQGISSITQDNVKSNMAIIMPKAEEIINCIRHGKIDVGKYDNESAITDSENGFKYTPVIDENRNTIAKLKTICETYFTQGYCDENLYASFKAPNELYKEINGALYLNVDAGGGSADKYDAETAQLVMQSSDTILVSMTCSDSNGKEYIAYVTFKLFDSVYKIDSITTAEK